jgi:hypothetical protein
MMDQPTMDSVALDEAIERGFIVARGRASLAPRAWREWCRDGRCPCVVVHSSSQLAEVELDLTPADWRLTDTGRAAIAAALTERRMSAECGAATLRTAGVPLARAEDFAAALLSILGDPASTSAP